MNEPTARRVLLVRAIELGDPDGTLLPQAVRIEATRIALGDETLPSPSPDQTDPEPLSPAQEGFVIRRSEHLIEGLAPRFPELQQTLDQVRWPGWLAPVMISLAFVLGLASNTLGPDQRINILAFPLLGMLIWNLAVYALILTGKLKRNRGDSGRLILQTLSRFALPHGGNSSSPGPAKTPDQSDLLRRRLAQFANQWLQLGKPLHLARATRLLHLCAATLAAGAVAGMYWRGLGFHYTAGWESTFLNEEAVRRILGIVLGPASILTGIPLPTTAELGAMAWPASTGAPAAKWIHLYATTTALFILLPRLTLAAVCLRTERHFESRFPMPDTTDSYFRRLLSVRQGRGDHVRVVPCGFQPGDREKVRGVLGEWLGLSAQVEFEDPVAYGMEDHYLEQARAADVSEYLVLMFNLASTPEEETHGRLIEGLKRMIQDGHGARRLLLILEESAYRGKLKGQAGWEERLAERRKTWQRLADSHGMEMAGVDLDQDLGNWAGQHRHLLAREDNR